MGRRAGIGPVGLSLLAVLAGCVSTAPGFQRVGVQTVGPGGRAHKEVEANGLMSGAHLSGPPGPPRVYQEKGIPMPSADLQRLAELVAEVDAAGQGDAAPDRSSYEQVELTGPDGRRRVFTAADPMSFQPSAVAKIYGLVARQRVGGW